MSIVEYYLFCLQHGGWCIPALVDTLPEQLIPDEI